MTAHEHERDDDTIGSYRDGRSRSEHLFQDQLKVVPGGFTHRSRYRIPFPLFIRETAGAYKTDEDGHRYIDYWMGHGALILGHSEPAVVDALHRQVGEGLHAGGETRLGLRWAELVAELVPSVEQVRFASSGGEATQLAIRLARAHTGRDKIVKFEFGFHGWADPFAVGLESKPFLGVPDSTAASTVVLPFNDEAAVVELLKRDSDVAAIIVEPAGVFNDTVPVNPEFLTALSVLSKEYGVVLVLDEVVTGFRYGPGGAQEYFGIIPDLTTFGKIVSGGLPGGAVAGRSEIMRLLERPDDPNQDYIAHSGTWNANPVVASAGIATLEQIDESLTRGVKEAADSLRAELNRSMIEKGVTGVAYGRSSIVKLHFGSQPKIVAEDFSEYQREAAVLMRGCPYFDSAFDRAMVIEGVDFKGTTAFVSRAHGDHELDLTVQAFERALDRTLTAVGEPKLEDWMTDAH